jgi:hypothetical protein
MTIQIRIRHKSLGVRLNPDSVLKDSSNTSITFSKFQYFISNISLETANRFDYFRNPVRYALIKAMDNEGESLITLSRVPAKNYKTIRLGIGIDGSSNNGSSGVEKADPGNSMYWSWTDEYKFMVMEGRYAVADTSGQFIFHITGNSSYRQLELELKDSAGKPIQLKNGSEILIDAEISALFGAPNKVDFRLMNNVMSPENGATKIAENYGTGQFLRFAGLR